MSCHARDGNLKLRLRGVDLQSNYQWALDPAAVAVALFHQRGERLLDPMQLGDAHAHHGKFSGPDAFGLAAVSSVLQREQVGDLIEAEAQRLRMLDETQAPRVRLVVATDATQRFERFERFGDQAAALVIADRLDMDIRRPGEAPMVKSMVIDSVVDYGSKVTP